MISAIHFFRLGVLMEQFRAHILTESAAALSSMQHLHGPVKPEITHQPDGHIVVNVAYDDDSLLQAFRGYAGLMEDLVQECGVLDLETSRVAAGLLLGNLRDESVSQYGIRAEASTLATRLSDELRMRLCFVVKREDRPLVEDANLFGDEVATRFPGAMVDIGEAGRCLALGRATACVFHLMRVLEVGLQAIAGKLRVTPTVNWESTLNQIDGAINKLPRQTTAEQEHKSNCAAMSSHLRNVKNAWRNNTMHPNQVYTRDQARDIWNHCRTFMVALVPVVSGP